MSRAAYFWQLARFLITCWVGAAALFVLLTITEIRSGKFDTLLLDQVVLIRFPIYYWFTMILVPASWLAFLVYSLEPERRLLTRSVLGLLTMSLLVLLGDYFLAYLPLRAMLQPLGTPRPQSFHFYHQLTEWLNQIGFLLNLMAALALNFSEPCSKLKSISSASSVEKNSANQFQAGP